MDTDEIARLSRWRMFYPCARHVWYTPAHIVLHSRVWINDLMVKQIPRKTDVVVSIEGEIIVAGIEEGVITRAPSTAFKTEEECRSWILTTMSIYTPRS